MSWAGKLTVNEDLAMADFTLLSAARVLPCVEVLSEIWGLAMCLEIPFPTTGTENTEPEYGHTPSPTPLDPRAQKVHHEILRGERFERLEHPAISQVVKRVSIRSSEVDPCLERPKLFLSAKNFSPFL